MDDKRTREESIKVMCLLHIEHWYIFVSNVDGSRRACYYDSRDPIYIQIHLCTL